MVTGNTHGAVIYSRDVNPPQVRPAAYLSVATPLLTDVLSPRRGRKSYGVPKRRGL